MAKGSTALRDRDRYWLRHHRACEQSGLTAKAYAKRHRLSIHGLYQARKRLRSLGALAAAEELASKPGPRRGSGFARVDLSAAASPRYRVRLPNGALVEWEGASGPDLAEVLGAVSRLG
jgi:hypothetical protein